MKAITLESAASYVSRTSTEPSPLEYKDFGYVKPKDIFLIRGRPVFNVYDSVRYKIRQLMAKQIYFSIEVLRIDYTCETSMAVVWSSTLANSQINEANERSYKIQDLIFRETKVLIDVETRGGICCQEPDLKPLTNMGGFERVEYSLFPKIVQSIVS